MISDEVIRNYMEALRAVYGDEFADKSELRYEFGWYGLKIAHEYPDGSIGSGSWRWFPDSYREEQILEMTENLKKRAGRK